MTNLEANRMLARHARCLAAIYAARLRDLDWARSNAAVWSVNTTYAALCRWADEAAHALNRNDGRPSLSYALLRRSAR